jgi:hypothetical protein
MQNVDHNIGFREKRQFFRRKLAKIAENCDHNIDPWSHFLQETAAALWPQHFAPPRLRFRRYSAGAKNLGSSAGSIQLNLTSSVLKKLQVLFIATNHVIYLRHHVIGICLERIIFSFMRAL